MGENYAKMLENYEINRMDAVKEYVRGRYLDAILRLTGQINLFMDKPDYREHQIFNDYKTLESFIANLEGKKVISRNGNGFVAMQNTKLADIALKASKDLHIQYNGQKAYDEIYELDREKEKNYSRILACALAAEKAGILDATDRKKSAYENLSIEETLNTKPASFRYDPANGLRKSGYCFSKQ